MLTPLECCALCVESYDSHSDATWDLILPEDTDQGIHATVRIVEGLAAVVFRGSVTPEDWFRDAISELFESLDGYSELGLLPLGFSLGILPAYQSLMTFIGDRPIQITGHSLGAAHASYFGAMCLINHRLPIQITTFGQPRPGMDTLKEVLMGVSQASYRNRDDPVTQVPTNPPYIHPSPLIPIEGPIVAATGGILQDHHILNYQAALAVFQQEK